MSLPSLLEQNGDVSYVLCIVFFMTMLFSMRKFYRSMRACSGAKRGQRRARNARAVCPQRQTRGCAGRGTSR